MGIGVGIFLIAVGAVLAFAVHATVAGLDIVTVGVILMVVGVLGIALDLAIFAPRRRTVSYTPSDTVPVTGTRTTVTRNDVV